MYEIDSTLPRSTLAELEEFFPLPLPCDEANNTTRPPHIITHFVFFLAEMSLRAILERILTNDKLEAAFVGFSPAPTQKAAACNMAFSVSPVTQELRSQLDTWILRLPASLSWSVEPGSGALSAQSTRLKLLYWYARFSLHCPMMQRTLDDELLPLPFLLWEPFREGLLPALNLIKVFVAEKPNIDVFMATRYADRRNKRNPCSTVQTPETLIDYL